MMRVERLDQSDFGQWEELVRICQGHGLHMPGVYLADHDPSTLQLLRFEDQGETVACAIALDLAPGRLGWLRKSGRVLQLPTAPAIADSSAARGVRDALFAYARDLGAERLIMQPGYGTWITGDADLERFRTHSITEFVLDLRRDHEQILAGMHKIHRKNIRRAAKAELELVEDSSVEGLLRLREMQLASSERADARTEGFAVQDEAFFRRVHENVYGGDLGTVLFARSGGEYVAALAWLKVAERVLTVRSGSLPLGYQSRAMYLLHDELIRRALADSIIELNIGGVPSEASQPDHPQSGLYEFKNGFGGQPMQRHALDIPLKEIDR